MSQTNNNMTASPVPMLDVTRQNKPLQAEFEKAMAEVFASGAFIHGPACHQFEASIAQLCGTQHAIGCASGSDALLLPLMAYGVGPGDEVLIPSFTFFATAGAVSRLGATPVFVDILPETYNLDPADVARKITEKTKAIIPVHLFGQCADLETLKNIAGGIPILEDACQAIGATQNGKPAGSLGDVGCFSFYPTKNLGGCGDSGIITTNDTALAEKIRHLRDHGQHPRYHHHIIGLNSRLDALQAAILSVKLPHLDTWSAARNQHADRYLEAFAGSTLITAPTTPQEFGPVWNQYTIRVKHGLRDQLQAYLAERKIGAAIYYPIPLHQQDCYLDLGYETGSLPHTEQAAKEVLSLPVFPELTFAEQTTTIEAIKAFCALPENQPSATHSSTDQSLEETKLPASV